MNSKRQTLDNALIVVLGSLLALSLVALAFGYAQLDQRQMQLTERFLKSNEQALHARLDGLFLEIQEDLREEADAVIDLDTIGMGAVTERWRILLRSHPVIQRIRMADQWGDEVSLERTVSGLVQQNTARGSRSGPPIAIFLADSTRSPLQDSIWLSDEDNDPRRKVWFAKALEDPNAEPAWTFVTRADSSQSLQISYLIRAHSSEQPFHILMFDVDLGESQWLDTRTLANGSLHGVIFDADLSILGHTLSPGVLTDRTELRRILSERIELDSEELVPVRLHGRAYLGQVAEHPLNGLLVYILVLVEKDVVSTWMSVERWGLFYVFLVLLVISLLLTWLLLRRRYGNERIRQHAKRTRSLERRLTKATGERDVLNREVHHRVKNNLQVVSSLLNLQASRLEEGPVRSEFLRGKRRIDTIALVHHKMYDLKDLRNVDLQQFFHQLVTSLAVMHLPKSRTVSHELNANGIKADQDTAIELGIILCELVTNTYQHAFPYATGGHVDILLQPVESDLHRLIVKDNGRGLPANYTDGEGKLGLEIVEALSEQLNGSFHVRRDGAGVTFEVLFRMKWNTSAGDIIDTQSGE